MSWMCTLWPRPLMFLKSPKWSISVNYSFFMSKYPRISGITRSYHLYDFFDAIMCKKCVKTFPNLIKTNQMQQRTFLVPLILSALSHCHSGKFRQMEKYFKFLIGDTLIFWRKNCRVYQGGQLSPIWSLKILSDSPDHHNPWLFRVKLIVVWVWI